LNRLPAVVTFVWVAACSAQSPAASDVVSVRTRQELVAAVAAARPGARIEVAGGEYAGGLEFAKLCGEAGRPIVIAGADAKNAPRFVGGGCGLHLVDPRFVELRDLRFEGATGNGVNIDDGGVADAAARGIVLRGLRVADVGPRGNHDALKVSGLTGFVVEDCVVERWGISGGSGIDMVGCRDGVVQRCTFRHDADANATGGSGVQMKGGSSGVVVRGCEFHDAGSRAVNLGGSTGMEFFRPPLAAWRGTEKWEAKDLVVEGNLFVGSDAAVAFVGVDGAVVRCNTFVEPRRWVVRILQETREPGFVPCRRGVFESNLVVFRSSWSSGGVNVGDATAADTFGFAKNWWWCVDRPERSEPQLPVREKGGTCGVDPKLGKDWRLGAGSPAKAWGREALARGR